MLDQGIQPPLPVGPKDVIHNQHTGKPHRDGMGEKKGRTAPIVRAIFSGLGVYFFVNVAFLSRRNTNRFGISTLSCPFTLLALFPSGKSRMSPIAQMEECDSSCSVGCIFTKPPGESESGPNELDIQAVFGLGPYVGT